MADEIDPSTARGSKRGITIISGHECAARIYARQVIDDGPWTLKGIYRAAKRFDLDIAAWPTPPQLGGEDWDTYWTWRFEQTIFMVALNVRKLIEAAKLSVQFQGRPVEVGFARLTSQSIPTRTNYHRIGDYYELASPASRKIPMIELCHTLIHSYVLVPQFVSSPLDGLRLSRFYVASDYSRRKGLYVVEWPWFVSEFIGMIVQDDVVAIAMWRLPDGSDELVIPSNEHVDRDSLVALYQALSSRHRARAAEVIAKINSLSIPSTRATTAQAPSVSSIAT